MEPAKPLTPEQIALVAGKAKTARKRPWDRHDPAAKRKRASTLRMNDYEHALLHFVAGARQMSVQETLMALVRDAAHAYLAKEQL